MTKRIILTTLACCLTAGMIHAQSYTDHLQKQQSGTGTVTVNQSKELDALINGSASSTSKPTAKPSTSKPSTTTSTTKPSTTSSSTTKPSTTSSSTTTESTERREERRTTTINRSTSGTENENKNIVRRERKTETTGEESLGKITSTGKKVMKGSRKVTGYRIQVFAGGNSRADREKAQQAGNKVKAHFPSYPVYVHFYSPSWKCRVGNFVEYKEAEQALRRIRGLGYKQAVIVKGKISVQ